MNSLFLALLCLLFARHFPASPVLETSQIANENVEIAGTADLQEYRLFDGPDIRDRFGWDLESFYFSNSALSNKPSEKLLGSFSLFSGRDSSARDPDVLISAETGHESEHRTELSLLAENKIETESSSNCVLSTGSSSTQLESSRGSGSLCLYPFAEIVSEMYTDNSELSEDANFISRKPEEENGNTEIIEIPDSFIPHHKRAVSSKKSSKKQPLSKLEKKIAQSLEKVKQAMPEAPSKDPEDFLPVAIDSEVEQASAHSEREIFPTPAPQLLVPNTDDEEAWKDEQFYYAIEDIRIGNPGLDLSRHAISNYSLDFLAEILMNANYKDPELFAPFLKAVALRYNAIKISHETIERIRLANNRVNSNMNGPHQFLVPGFQTVENLTGQFVRNTIVTAIHGMKLGINSTEIMISSTECVNMMIPQDWVFNSAIYWMILLRLSVSQLQREVEGALLETCRFSEAVRESFLEYDPVTRKLSRKRIILTRAQRNAVKSDITALFNRCNDMERTMTELTEKMRDVEAISVSYARLAFEPKIYKLGSYLSTAMSELQSLVSNSTQTIRHTISHVKYK